MLHKSWWLLTFFRAITICKIIEHKTNSRPNLHYALPTDMRPSLVWFVTFTQKSIRSKLTFGETQYHKILLKKFTIFDSNKKKSRNFNILFIGYFSWNLLLQIADFPPQITVIIYQEALRDRVCSFLQRGIRFASKSLGWLFKP